MVRLGIQFLRWGGGPISGRMAGSFSEGGLRFLFLAGGASTLWCAPNGLRRKLPERAPRRALAYCSMVGIVSVLSVLLSALGALSPSPCPPSSLRADRTLPPSRLHCLLIPTPCLLFPTACFSDPSLLLLPVCSAQKGRCHRRDCIFRHDETGQVEVRRCGKGERRCGVGKRRSGEGVRRCGEGARSVLHGMESTFATVVVRRAGQPAAGG